MSMTLNECYARIMELHLTQLITHHRRGTVSIQLWDITAMVLDDNTAEVKLGNHCGAIFPVLQGLGQGQVQHM